VGHTLRRRSQPPRTTPKRPPPSHPKGATKNRWAEIYARTARSLCRAQRRVSQCPPNCNTVRPLSQAQLQILTEMGFEKEAAWEAVCLHGGDTTMQVEWLQQSQVRALITLPFVVRNVVGTCSRRGTPCCLLLQSSLLSHRLLASR
jgi:hypothetical protein